MQINDKSNSTIYIPNKERYNYMSYNRSGKSGVLLPAIALGLWHNFGFVDALENGRSILRTAFDLGITHFDLANNYGPPYGSAETNFGTIFKQDFKAYRDELFIATKAGYDMWPGPYGNWGSRKYLTASLNQSLKRMELDYIDVFYHHRPDPNTPLEETMGALTDLVHQGKALYVGISNYNAEDTLEASKILKASNTPFIINQVNYSMLDRWIEAKLLKALSTTDLGCIVFSPLAQGMLTNRYLDGIPKDSRAAKTATYLEVDKVKANHDKILKLNKIAKKRDQTLSQMAIAWILRLPEITSVLVGASSSNQLIENVKALDNLHFEQKELNAIEKILKENS
jgi:L-glyceraldehyde 3-phosphate reductase